MFDLTKKVSTYLTFALALPAFAQNLPSFTADCGRDQVRTPIVADLKYPGVDLNGGYATDRDCRQIYVLPPSRGRFVLASVAHNSSLDLFCPVFNGAAHNMSQVNGIITATLDKMAQTDDDAQLEVLNKNLDRMYDRQEYIKDALKDPAGFEGLTAQVQFEHDWEAVVRAYKAANPEKTVSKMPLIGAYLSATLKFPSTLSEVANLGTFAALKSAEIPGTSLESDVLNFTESTNPNRFDLSSSLGGQIKLSLAGACPYWDALQWVTEKNKLDFGDYVEEQRKPRGVRPSLAPYLVANMQYFYPLETKFSYKMHYKAEVLASHFAELIKTKSTFDAKEIEEDLIKIENKERMGVEIIYGVGTPDPGFEEQIRGLTQDLRIDLVQTLLSKIATPKEPSQYRDVPLPTDPHSVAFGNEYVCHTSRTWYGRKKKKCFSRSYTLKIAREAVAAAIEKAAMDVIMDNEKKIEVYKTFTMSGSLGFVE